MNQIALLFTATLAGLVSGFLGGRVALRATQRLPEQTLRAHRFELVNESGRTIAFWGFDKNNNAVLAFGSNWPNKPDITPNRSNASSGIEDLSNQRATLGVIDDDPFLHLRAADGRTRVRLYLSDYGKPMLLMEDQQGPRVSLGIEQSDTPGPQDDDWTLDFGPDSRARIGVYTEKVADQTFVRGLFSIKPDRFKYPYEQTR